MPYNRRPAYQKPAIDRTLSLYEMCILAGHIVSVKDGELCFEPPTLHPMLRRQVEANKAALLAHLRTLPPKSWADVGRAEEFEEVGELAF